MNNDADTVGFCDDCDDDCKTTCPAKSSSFTYCEECKDGLEAEFATTNSNGTTLVYCERANLVIFDVLGGMAQLAAGAFSIILQA